MKLLEELKDKGFRVKIHNDNLLWYIRVTSPSNKVFIDYHYNLETAVENVVQKREERRVTLKGKITQISYTGEWELTLDGRKKVFEKYSDLISYLGMVLQKGRDKDKLALLKSDFEYLNKGP